MEEKDGRRRREEEGGGVSRMSFILREEAFAHFCSSSTIYTRERLEERRVCVHR